MRPLTSLIEAALFSAAHPLSVSELKKLDRETGKADVIEALDELRRVLDDGRHGVELVEVADGFQLLTRSELAETIVKAQIVTRPRRLSAAALETLAIIAYRQPVARSEIEEIRGVASDGVLRSLQDRGLIDSVERGEGMGRPLLYGTTPGFLELLGLTSVEELPLLEELAVELTPPQAVPPIPEE
ncbi:MAG: SMC-Scp complex subunit ScpB [Gemmatimonadales bacterium]